MTLGGWSLSTNKPTTRGSSLEKSRNEGVIILATTTTPSDGSGRSLNPIVETADEKPSGYLVWVYDALLFSVGPGRARLATVQRFDTIEEAEEWAQGVRQYEIHPLDEIPEDADLPSRQAVRQMIAR